MTQLLRTPAPVRPGDVESFALDLERAIRLMDVARDLILDAGIITLANADEHQDNAETAEALLCAGTSLLNLTAARMQEAARAACSREG